MSLVSGELWEAAVSTLPWTPHSPLSPSVRLAWSLPSWGLCLLSRTSTLFAVRQPLPKISWPCCPFRTGSDKSGLWGWGAGFHTWNRWSAAQERRPGVLLSASCAFTHGNSLFLLPKVGLPLTLPGSLPLKLGALVCERSLTQPVSAHPKTRLKTGANLLFHH